MNSSVLGDTFKMYEETGDLLSRSAYLAANPLKSNEIELPVYPANLDDKSERDMLELIVRSISILPAIKEDLSALHSTHNTNVVQVSKLIEENESMKLRMSVLEGKNMKLENDFSKLKEVVLDIQSRQMRENILIQGLAETPRENCVHVVKEFFKNSLHIPDGDVKVDVAHRIGKQTYPRQRQMVVKLIDRGSKITIFKHVKNLKGTTYSVVDQLPNEVRERRIAQVPTWKQLKQEGNSCKFIGDRLTVSGEVKDPEFSKNPLAHATSTNLLPITKFAISEVISDRGSKFRAYATRVTDTESASNALSSLFQEEDVANATHRIYAYSLDPEHGWNDDGEYGSAKKLYNDIKETDHEYYIVCVIRKFGGQYLGKDRFTHISKCALDALDRL